MCCHAPNVRLSPKPLVRELVNEDEVTGDRIREEELRVERPGLVLEREVEVLGIIDHAARGPERIGAEVLLLEGDDLGLSRE